MALTAPSSTLTGQTIAASYDQVLFLDAAAGVTEATLKIVSGTAGKTALSISDEHVLVKGVDTNNAAGFAVHQTDGTAVFTVNASSPAFTLTGNATITTADNTDTLKLISTDADASVGPSLNFYRNSGSPADNDNIGILKATGRNDNSQDVDYVLNYNSIGDASDGTEDGRFETYVMLAGTARSRVKMDETETIFNNDSVDLDFRVESDNNANALFVQGSDGNVGIGTAAPLATLSVAQAFDGATDAGIGFYSSSNANYRNYISSNLSGSANASVMHFYVNQSSGAETQVMTLKGEGNVGIGEAAPETQVEISGTAPYLTFHNTTHEDADGGRETKIKFKGERSGGEELTMAQIYLMQQGSEDDNNSLMRFQVNTNAGGVDTLTAMLDLDSSSDVKVMSGDLVFSAAGKGIVLGVTSNADENTLDDYEEGTFSPTFLGSSSNPTQSYAYQVGIYTKIGREVILHGRIGLSGSGITPGSGTLQLGNLPFTSLSTTHSHGSVVISFSGDFLTANTGAPTHGYVNYNAVTCDLYTYDNDAGNVASTTATNAADADENAGILYSVTYTAA